MGRKVWGVGLMQYVCTGIVMYIYLLEIDDCPDFIEGRGNGGIDQLLPFLGRLAPTTQYAGR